MCGTRMKATRYLKYGHFLELNIIMGLDILKKHLFCGISELFTKLIVPVVLEFLGTEHHISAK